MAVITDSTGAEVLPRDDYAATGSMAALNSTVVISCHGSNMVTVDLSGTFNGTVSFQGTIDGTNWFSLAGSRIDVPGDTYPAVFSAGAFGPFRYMIGCAGCMQVRLIMSTWVSGTALAFLRATWGFLFGNNYLARVPPATGIAEVAAAVNTTATLTLTPGTGLRIYLTSLTIYRFYSVLGVAGAGPAIVSTTNLSLGSFPFSQAASPQGTMEVQDYNWAPAIPAQAPTTAVTVVATAQLQTIWRIHATYYQGA